MTERDFVLNKIIHSDWTASDKNISELKEWYKTICENTSEEGDEDFIYEIEKSFRVIKFKKIHKFDELDGYYKVFDKHNDYQSWHKVSEKERFKQWFERKRGK